MMKAITKLWMTLLLLCVAGVVNAATEYEVDQKFTSVAALDGQMFVIYNETDAKAIYNKDAQNLAYDTYANAVTGAAYLWKLHSLADEGIAELANAYAIEAIKADGTSQSLWGHSPLYLNSGAEGGFDGCFALGNGTQYGTDVLYGGAWEIEYDADKGFALKNVARGGYFAGVNPAPTGTEPIYWTFCTMKEKESTDPLAEQKDALTAAIATGKMYNAVAYTEATFSTLSTAIADGETALAAAEATAESLTDATTAINDAIAALTLKDGFSNLTAEQFMSWDSATEPYSGTSTGCSYELFKPSGLPYGDGNVGWKNFALLSDFDKLYVTFTEGTPRIMMNRDVDQGQWNEDETQSHLIEFPKGDAVWSAKYFTNENGVVTIDLKQIVTDKGIASLNAIKGANWANVTVTGLFLYKEAVAPVESEITLLPSDLTAIENAEFTGSKGDVNVACTTGTVTADQIRVFKNQTITFSSTKLIKKIVFTCTAQGTAKYGPGCFNAQEGYTFEAEGNTGTWEGSASSVSFTAESNQVRLSQVVITLGEAAPVEKPATPTFTPAAGEYFAAQDVTIACETEDAAIYYTLDGTDPTAESALYTEPIAIAETTTVKAIAIKEGQTSEVAEAIYTISAPAIADGTYYIKNVASGNFFTGANSWGTQASVAPSGAPFEVTMLPEGGYSLKYILSTVNNKFLGSNLYVDSTTPAGGFAIEKNADGTFAIKLAGKYLAEGTEKGSTNDAVVIQADELTDAAKWQILTFEEAVAAMKNGTNVTATFMISNPNFNRNTSTAAWNVSADCTNKNLGGGDNGNFCAESYHSPFTISQVIANVPAGKYQMTAQGFYRQDDDANEAAPMFFANDKEAQVPVKTGSENSMTDASHSFTSGLYTIEPIEFTVFEDGQLTIGVKNNGNAHQWVIWDNFQLTYLTSEIPAEEFKPAYEAALAAAQAALTDEAYAIVTGEEKAALEKAIEDYTTVEETVDAYKAAISALNAATNAFTSAKADYVALVNAKETVQTIDFSVYPYASQAKIAAAVAALNAEATSAADAKTKTQAIFNSARTAVESNALLEDTYGAVNYSDSIAAANADQNTGWTSGSIGTNQGQGYTDGNGEVCGKYLDGGWSGSAGANIDLVREVKIPAGKYILSVTARGSVDLTEYSLSIAGQTIELPHIGADGISGVFGNGWNDAFVVFEKENDEPATLEIKAISEATQQWVSLNRFRLVKFGEAGEEDPIIEAPEGKVNLIANGNLAGESVESFFSKEQGVSADPVASTIVAMAGKNLSRGIVVKSADNPSQAWDTQFWIYFNQPLPEGTKLHVEFDYVASKAAKGSTQAHAAPGEYQHWAAIGDVNFTTEWQHFSNDITVDAAMAKGDNGNGSGTGMQSVAFNLAEEKTATEYRFDNFGVWAEIPEPVQEWENLIVNSDIEGESMECFYVTEQGVGGPFVAIATEGIGKDGSKAVKVQSADDVTDDTHEATDWDSQFFIRLPYQLPAGTKYKVSFDYKADKAGDFDTQAHANPGQYIHWAFCGSGSFTTEWQTYEKEGTVPAECDGSSAQKTFQTIAFNLAKNRVATEFVFDNVKFLVPKDIVSSLTLNPDENPVPYPTGIQTVNTEKNAEGIFNLNGQKVMKAQKGLYIKNGKKVVIK